MPARSENLKPAKKGEPSRNPQGRSRREAIAAAAVLFGDGRAKELSQKVTRKQLDGWEQMLLVQDSDELGKIADDARVPVYAREVVAHPVGHNVFELLGLWNFWGRLRRHRMDRRSGRLFIVLYESLNNPLHRHSRRPRLHRSTNRPPTPRPGMDGN